MFAFDYWYLVLVLPGVLFSFACQGLVHRRFKQYSGVMLRRRMTGSDAAEIVCQYFEARHTRVETVSGHLRDHFDPRHNVIRLSDAVYYAPSVAAVSIAAHEGGHAAQHAAGYLPYRLRGAMIPTAQIASNLAMPAVLAGLIFSFDPLITIGILLFSIAVFLQLITLPVEFHASRMALRSLENAALLDEDELQGAKKVLTAAALTYVAALAIALGQLLRLMLLSQGKRRR